MVATEHPTFCKQCEALCGVVAHVEDGKVINISADRENPFSRGFVCPKPGYTDRIGVWGGS
jgi:anaerobic selenocysteine-containing dehydrogenase